MTARSSFYGNRQRTVADRKTAMTQLLYGCTDKALAELTIATLASRYGFDARECEYALTIARQKRA